MKKNVFRSTYLVLSLCLLGMLATSCDELEDVFPIGKDTKTKVYYGPATALGHGTVSSWVKTGKDGKPLAIGFKVSADALAMLEDLPSQMYFLSLPQQAGVMPYQTLELDWNQHGHEPEGVYTLPHFDFHFYMISKDDVMNIAGGPDPGANTLLEKGVLPTVYTFGPEPIAVPQMGVHWADVTSPEYSPAGFSKTFIYGSHGDKVSFLEPMITRAYLMSLDENESVKTSIPQLLKFEKKGYYPGTYTVTYDAQQDAYLVSLTDLKWHNAD
ncbi:hypothetical protein [Pontibacter chitinilyticus]|uniref:hypothetical protein n=1 Tax=Pontibacter chitinilyticus TaxID=2674989 RepID=UPI003218F148